MKAHKEWSYAPYRPPFFYVGDIYICRIVPGETAIHFEWLPAESVDSYTVFFRKKGEGRFQAAGTTVNCEFDLQELESGVDYEFYVSGEDGRNTAEAQKKWDSRIKKSRIRLARTAACTFGTAVNYLHPEDEAFSFSGKYLCSPSFVRMPDGSLVASMDLFAASYPQNLLLIFRSEDNGQTWHYACELFPCFWGKLFLYQGDLYVLGCSTEYGDLLIGKSVDGGRSFGEPRVLLRGSNGKNGEVGVHKNPQPVIEYGGRIWNTLEWGSWGRGYHAAMIASAQVGSDIMEPESWLFSEPTIYDSSWPGIPEGDSPGTLEGCPVITPEGKLCVIMRYQMEKMEPNFGLALVYDVNAEDPEKPMQFCRTMQFPANHSKFEIKYDEKSGYYYTLASRITDRENAGSRNLLSLMRSVDLVTWEVVCDVIDRRSADPRLEGYQYVDFEIEGDDILYLCRAAMNGAHNYHDANYSVFARIRDFRKIAGAEE